MTPWRWRAAAAVAAVVVGSLVGAVAASAFGGWAAVAVHLAAGTAAGVVAYSVVDRVGRSRRAGLPRG